MQKLWDGVIPLSRKKRGYAPDADAAEVTRRVNAALDEELSAGRRSIRLWRPIRYALVFGAIIILLAGTAVASGQVALPERNVLDDNFKNISEYAISLMDTEVYSISDENYTLAVTSNFADENRAYYTVIIKPKTEEARRFLKGEDAEKMTSLFGEVYFPSDIDYLVEMHQIGFGSETQGGMVGYDEDMDAFVISRERELGPGLHMMAVRFYEMEPCSWMLFPLKRLPSVKLNINADGEGTGVPGGPLTLERVTLSPVSITMRYTGSASGRYLRPVVYFLWKDGTLESYGQRDMSDARAYKEPALFSPLDRNLERYSLSWEFREVVDLREMEAIVFEDTAYPLDGGKPYPYDVGEIPRPFVVASGEVLGEGGNPSMPLFAICDGLGIPYEWDKEAGTVTAAFRGVTITFTAGSDIARLEGAEIPEHKMRTIAVLSDGELWIDALWELANCWKLEDHPVEKDSQWDSWMIIP